jgi:hypothetical protein
METSLMSALIALQFFVVAFIALHDWVPLGKLNNLEAVHAADPAGQLFIVTSLSTLPFAIGLVASARYVETGFPGWLMWWLWISYGAAVYGMLRAWWVPYLLIASPERATRYQARFAGTHAFLPIRNGIRPDTLHCVLHMVILTILVLLGVLAFALRGGSLGTGSTLSLADWRPADANLGTNKMGSGAYGPSGVQGQSPWPYAAARIAAALTSSPTTPANVSKLASNRATRSRAVRS